MPSEFHRRGDVSILRLVEDSDYRAHQNVISVADFQKHLQTHPELIVDWYVYSDNKRTTSGWYFDYAARQVGYHSGSRPERQQTFDDVTQACAAFIKYEMDSIVGRAS